MTMTAPNYMFYAPYVKDTADYWREALEPVSVRFVGLTTMVRVAAAPKLAVL
jgi:hypothetical protein